jgi:hypothetical protein
MATDITAERRRKNGDSEKTEERCQGHAGAAFRIRFCLHRNAPLDLWCKSDLAALPDSFPLVLHIVPLSKE